MNRSEDMVARAAISDGRGSFMIDEVRLGPPRAGEVVVRIQASGVCHTDYDHLSQYQAMMGHEGAGVVEAVGTGVTRVAPGDQVLLNWAVPCGACFQCRAGAEHLCQDKPKVPDDRVDHRGRPLLRSFGLGTMAERTIVRQEAVTALPTGIPWASACILGCGVMTGFGSAVNAAQVARDSSVAVLGAGGVGLNVIQGCRYAGARTIVAIDIAQCRLDSARKFGATDVVLAERDPFDLDAAVTAVRRLTDNRGADYAFECTAIPELGVAPLALVRDGGTAVAVSGVEEHVQVDMRLFEWDKTYINPLYGQCRPSRDFPRLIQLYQNGQLRLDELITRTYRLDTLQDAFDDMLAGRISKGVVLLGTSQ